MIEKKFHKNGFKKEMMDEYSKKDLMVKGKRVNLAYGYLNDLGLLKGGGGLGNINGAQIFFVMRLLPEGINIIENQPEFKRNFGFEVNLGLLKFSWGASEK